MVKIKVAIDHLPNGYNKVAYGGARTTIEWSGSQDLTIDGGDSETRPSNVAMHCIMAIRAGVKLPVGAVFPYAGCEAKPLANPFLKCQGHVVKPPGFQVLHDKIEDIYTVEKIFQSFHVPDMRRVFICGANSESPIDELYRDLEALARTLLNGTSDSVGSHQNQATNTDEWNVNISGGSGSVENGKLSTKQHWSGFAPETRPTNDAMNYISALLRALNCLSAP